MPTVVLVSGGLDSYIAYRLAPEPKVGLWVHLGQPYATKEEAAVDGLGMRVEKVHCSIPIIQPTIAQWIIPGRNLLLTTIAAMYGERIVLAALDGEMHKYARERDKSPEFYHLASGILTYVFDVSRPETVVETPFARLSKTEVIALALHQGINAEELRRTSSCYHAQRHNCGECGTCFKRWLAFKNNAIEEDYASPPWRNAYAVKAIAGIREAVDSGDFSHYSEKRCRETLRALQLEGIR